jgi:hypothetical protein
MGLTAFQCKKNKPDTNIHNEPWIWADLKITHDKNEQAFSKQWAQRLQ